MQTVIVALLVLGCATYAAWTLMPGVARRAVATALLRFPLPTGFAQKMRRAAVMDSGCGCDSCDRAPANASVKSAAQSAPQGGPATPQVITFHPRIRR